MKLIALILTAAMVICSGCAGFHMDCWVGYMKVPPEVGYPVFKVPPPLKFALTPAQIELIMSFLSSDAAKWFIQGAFPANNRVGIGAGCIIRVD